MDEDIGCAEILAWIEPQHVAFLKFNHPKENQDEQGPSDSEKESDAGRNSTKTKPEVSKYAAA